MSLIKLFNSIAKSSFVKQNQQNKTNSFILLLGANRFNSSFINQKSKTTTNIDEYLNEHDKTQVELLNENCILVDHNDVVIAKETKKNCHLLENINNGMLHRAFSIFLFDSKDRLLLQQRSKCKITYPNHWTNTCCSHPLYIKEELNGEEGIKRAAKRRLDYEFGICVDNHENFNYITRIHYKADNVPSDGIFGEHEIDYILFVKGDFIVNENKNEIKSYKYVTQSELKQLINDKSIEITPWFRLISSTYLFKWWSSIDNLNKTIEHNNIHRFL